MGTWESSNWKQDIERELNGCKEDNCNGDLLRVWDVKLDDEGNEIARYDDGRKCEECGKWQ